jgi:hypothetical protein
MRAAVVPRAATVCMWALVAAGTPARASAQSPGNAAYTLQVRRSAGGGSSAFASAFVVADRRAGHEGGLLLVTALHAIHHASSIQVLLESCPPSSQPLVEPFSADNPVDVVVWRRLDVAALVIPEAQAARILVDRAHLKTLTPATPPHRGDRVWVMGTGGSTACPPAQEWVMTDGADRLTAEWLFYNLIKADPSIYWLDVMGSLGNDVRLIEYSPATQRGTSGAAVTLPSSSRVLAVHLGGDSSRSGWGVLVDADTLDATMCGPAHPEGCVSLDARHPTLEIDDFRDPDFEQFDPRKVASEDVSRHGLALSGSVESSTPIDPFGAWSVSPVIGVSREVWSLPFAPMAAALALRVAAGPTFGQYRSPVRMRDGSEESALGGHAKLPFVGAIGAVGLDAHIARLSPVQVFAGLGLRVAYVHQGDVADRPDSVAWGPEIRAGVRWRLLPRVWGTVHLSVTYESIPVAATPQGCVGPSLRRDPVWDAWGGGGVGVEFEP